MVHCSFTSTETIGLVRTDSPGRQPRLSHSSWTMWRLLGYTTDFIQRRRVTSPSLPSQQSQVQTDSPSRCWVLLYVHRDKRSWRLGGSSHFVPPDNGALLSQVPPATDDFPFGRGDWRCTVWEVSLEGHTMGVGVYPLKKCWAPRDILEVLVQTPLCWACALSSGRSPSFFPRGSFVLVTLFFHAAFIFCL